MDIRRSLFFFTALLLGTAAADAATAMDAPAAPAAQTVRAGALPERLLAVPPSFTRVAGARVEPAADWRGRAYYTGRTLLPEFTAATGLRFGAPAVERAEVAR
ncbi:MAG: hypothetical protein AAGC67_02185 [Myxococcota bacterium]